MIENTDAEQIERLNSRVVELLREHDALLNALEDAKRFMEYFVDGHAHFVGPGTPKSCLAHIDVVLASIKEQS